MARIQQTHSGKSGLKRKKAIPPDPNGNTCTDADMRKRLRVYTNEKNISTCSKAFKKNHFSKKST